MMVRYARRAVAGLAEIGGFIAARSRKSADAVVSRIRTSIALLETLPRMGRETDDPDIRMFPVVRHPYLVNYEVLNGEVIVHHIRHGRRNLVDPRTLKR